MGRSQDGHLRGSTRPVVLGVAVVVATAAVVIAYALLMPGRGSGTGPTQQAKDQPKGQPSSAARVPNTSTDSLPLIIASKAKGPAVAAAPPPIALKDALFHELFSAPVLPGTKWVATRDGDFKEAVADVVGGRLRLRAGTIGTRDDTVKHLGLRTAEQVVDLTTPIEIAAEIDWNNQANGCYLQASLFLCPTATDKTAADEKDWLKFEYVGVPPGKNARACLSRRQAGNLRMLYTEGWPDKQKTGRLIGKQSVVLRLDAENISILENGKPLYGPEPHGCTFPRAYLYLEICSHSNYPPREIFFDNLILRPTPRNGL